MSDKEAAMLGMTPDGRGFLSKPEKDWQDDELSWGLSQLDAWTDEHRRHIAELDRLKQRLSGEEGRRKTLYADVAAALLGSGDDQGKP